MSRIVMTPTVLFFFNMTLAIRGLFWSHTNFRIVCSSSVINAGVLLTGIAFNVQFALCDVDILVMYVLPIHEHGMFLHFLFLVFFNFFHKRSIVVRV